MISNKKNYVEQLLHLALTLSLLRVDPENYLDLQWETRLAGTGAGGWQLELRATPLTDQTYVNRKALPAIIEDLALGYDAPQYNVPAAPLDVQAYLLNIQNETHNTSSSRAASPAPSSSAPAGQTAPSPGSAAASGPTPPPTPPPLAPDGSNGTSFVISAGGTLLESLLLPTGFDEDLFLNGDPFADSSEIHAENLADLNDFGEAPINSYALDAMPLKNEPPLASSTLFEELIRLPFSGGGGDQFSATASEEDDYHHHHCQQQQQQEEEDECCETCDVRKQHRRPVKVEVKEEPQEDEPASAMAITTSTPGGLQVVVVKSEPNDEENSGPTVTVELTQEEMDLIEVLWKQDMDLGFTLSPSALLGNGGQQEEVDRKHTVARNASDNAAATTTTTTSAEDDDLEKLKALLEIKHGDDKMKQKGDRAKDGDDVDDVVGDEEDPWAGLPYTIDNETGEYVLNATDATLQPPLADLFLEDLPELINPDADGIDDSVDEETKRLSGAGGRDNGHDADNEADDDDDEDDNNGNGEGIVNTSSNQGSAAATTSSVVVKPKQQPSHDEEEESEVKRIERELETSADELCQGASSTSSGSSSNNNNPAQSTIIVEGCSSSSPVPPATIASGSGEGASTSSCSEPGLTPADDLEDLLCDMMIQTSSSHFQHPRQPMQNYGHGMHGSLRQGSYHHHHHHHHHQSRVPLSRAVSMEQRWQDLANLLSFPPGMGVGMGVGDMTPAHPHAHYPGHYPYQTSAGGIAAPQPSQYHHSHAAVLQNASLADLGPPGVGVGGAGAAAAAAAAAASQPHYGPNLGSAVATSMHLTNSTSETDAGATGYKMDHEMMYYSNASSEMNHTDGFLNSILDDDLQLMDIAVNEGMYTMRMLDHNATSTNSTGTAGSSNASSVLGAGAGGGALGMNGHHPHHHHHHHHLVGGLISSAAAAAAAAAASGNQIPAGSAMQTTTLNGTAGGPSVVVGAGVGGPGGTTDRLDASSDSAVSSMGSERVPSLSDGEWGDGGSDSAQEYHNKYGGPFDYSYNSSTSSTGAGGAAGSAGGAGASGGAGSGRQPPVAQKKHHMFAKRYFQEQNTTIPAPGLGGQGPGGTSNGIDPQALPPIKYEFDYMNPSAAAAAAALGHLEGAVGPTPAPGAVGGLKQEDPTLVHGATAGPLVDMKYPYSLDFAARQNLPLVNGGGGPAAALRSGLQPHDVIAHNHTYTMPHASLGGANPKPQTRDKKLRHKADQEEQQHLTRDEKRARALQIPIPVHDIINLPMDEFNERLSKYDLSESQLSLIRDIRRRGKNKVAAQNCRKRKLDQIVSLADEVKEMKMRKERLQLERDTVLSERKKIRDKFSALYRHVFQNLRDADGNPYSQEHWSLQQSADGTVVLVPRSIDRQQQQHQQQEIPNGGSNGSSSTSSSTSNSSSSNNGGSNSSNSHQQIPGVPGGSLQQHQSMQQQHQQQQQHNLHHLSSTVPPHPHHHLPQHLQQQQQQQHHSSGGSSAISSAAAPTSGNGSSSGSSSNPHHHPHHHRPKE